MLAAITLALWLGTTAAAHHSLNGQFDLNRNIQISGTITKIKLWNPHCEFYVDVKDSTANRIRSWKIVYGGNWFFNTTSSGALSPNPGAGVLTVPLKESSNQLFRVDEVRMFSNLKPGASVSISGFPSRDGADTIAFLKLTDAQANVLIETSRIN
jgi:hypothetical protein